MSHLRNRFALLIFFVLFFTTNVMSAEKFASIESKAYKNFYDERDYHLFRGEYNLDSLDDSKYPEMTNYVAEAFVSQHIYEIDVTRDLNEEFHFGQDNIAKLIKYEFDKVSGFNAGLYRINGGRLIIAFGGTTAKESFLDNSTDVTVIQDLITDLLLLSNKTASGQVNRAIIFTQNIQTEFPSESITVTGHSLGGGLAQIASLSSKNYDNYHKIKSITFNTAPVPITLITKPWIENFDLQKEWSDSNNINFMTNIDQLTNILESIESYVGNNLSLLQLQTGNYELNEYLNNNIKGQILKVSLLTVLENLLDIKANEANELIYGQRILLNTNTDHFMVPLLDAAFNNIRDFSNFQNRFFLDVTQYSLLYDAIFSLLQNHSISYPKLERESKFFPNENVLTSEFAIFIVNSFYYKDFIEEKKKFDGETRFGFFHNKFPDAISLNINDNVSVTELNDFLTALFIDITNKELDKYSTAWYSTNISKTSMKLRLLAKYFSKEHSVILRSDDSSNVTRGQLATQIMNFNTIDWENLVKDTFTENHKISYQFFMSGFKKILFDEVIFRNNK
ncbi:hypothetical protein N9X61_00710 [Sulfurimonas sp.]|nr:hypothetical protein [Sulfurimonas sp.]